MSAPRLSVLNIPSARAFVDDLAAGILKRHGGDALEFSDLTILLPTRRACRSLREAFLRLGGGKPMLLPVIRPIGDVEEDELLLSGDEISGLGAELLELPEAVPALRRELLLVQLILRFDARQREDGETGMDAAQAARLARDLAALIDQVQTEQLSFERLRHIVPEDLANHWQLTLEFLEIVTRHWPAMLEQEGFVDPALRRNSLLAAQAEAWRARPPDAPVIAAGSTGSIPATARLLKVIAGLPRGCVVLPGLDLAMGSEAWDAVGDDPGHAQYGLHQLLEHFGLKRGDVERWSEAVETTARGRLIERALLPAAAVAGWTMGYPVEASATDNFLRLDCPGPVEEARAIALMMREALETPARTAALVTPDRGLARRVAANFARWDIEVDDSAGQPLARTPVGVFLKLTAEAVIEGLAPVELLAALKHPLSSGGEATAQFRARVRRFEIAALHGPRPAAGLNGLLNALPGDEAGLIPWLEGLGRMQAQFAELAARPSASLNDLLAAHMDFAQALAADDEQPGEARLWAGDDGEAAAQFIDELHQAAKVFPDLAGALYPALLDGLMAGRVVRPRYGRHPRLAIWGLLEARLQQSDLMILGGLNEGAWPPLVETGPWLSRPMRGDFGLPQPERHIGLAAHDFVQAAASDNVVITRSAKLEGAPTVPARWLLRIGALLDGAGLSWPSAQKYLAWGEALDDPGHAPRPVEPPRPRPPIAARPRKLSVTEIETWVRDPYAIFAKHILALRPLDAIDADPGAAERGGFIHQALDEFVAETPWPPPGDAAERLLEIGRECFSGTLDRPGVWAFWWPRFERSARWFVEQLRADAEAGAAKPAAVEVWGRRIFEAPGGDFEVFGKADRIDRDAEGGLTIIDYKTGAVPAAKHVADGRAPQLAVEALIAETGGFDGLEAGAVNDLSYWRLGGGEPAGKVIRVGGDVAQVLTDTLQRLESLIAAFDDADTPYRARPRPAWAPAYADYDLLARVDEWSAEDEGDGG